MSCRRRSLSLPRLPGILLVLGLAICGGLVGCGPEAHEPLPEPPGLADFDPAVQEQYRQLTAELEGLDGRADDAELAEAYGRLGMWHQVYRLLDVAEVAYGRARALAPEEPRWPYYLGMLFDSHGEPQEARAYFEDALELAPGSEATRVHLAEQLFELGEWEEARAHLEAALESDPRCVRCRVALAKVRMEQDDPQRAIELLEEALRIQSSSNEIRHALGLAYRAAGLVERARAHLELARSDGQVDYLRMKDPWSRALLDLDVGYSGNFRRGREALSQGRYRVAQRLFLEAVEGNPEVIEGHLGLVRSWMALGQPTEAYRVSSVLLERFPSEARAPYAHGEVCTQLPEHADEAEAWFQRAIELQPDFVPAHISLADLARSRGDEAAAAELLGRASALAPEDASLLNRWARALDRAGRRQDAIGALEAGLERELDKPWGSRLLLEELKEAQAEGGS